MDFVFESVVWLVSLALLVLFLGRRLFRGRFGELKVRATTGLRLPSSSYTSLHNLTLPTPDGTTQVDHVIVSRFGVFVIETKNMTGWIFGDERSREWTQSIYGNNYRFQNPLHQDFKHMKAVEAATGLPLSSLHSVVVFAGRSRFKTRVPPNVMRRSRLSRYIKSKTAVLLSEEQVEQAIRVLSSAGSTTRADRRRHIENLRENRKNPKCPRCGRAMVIRTAKRGRSAGGQFWGCTGYPNCRATKNVGRR
jgi:hypothetical protein